MAPDLFNLLRKKNRPIRVLSSYPRSGTHWLKRMISKSMGIPAVNKRYNSPSDLLDTLNSKASKGLIFEHFVYDEFHTILNPEQYPGLRMILLYRNPLDQMISEFFGMAAQGNLPHDKNLGAIDNLKIGLKICRDKYPDYMRNQIRYRIIDWMQSECCYPVRYEDLVSDTKYHLALILDHLKVNYTTKRINKVIQISTFEKLSGGRKPGQVDVNDHYRRGIPGEWREVYDDEDLKIIRDLIGEDYLNLLGYRIEY